MKTTIFALAVLGLMSATPVLADGKVYVQLPDLSGVTAEETPDFLKQVVIANVISSNCPGYEITDAQWSLLTDSADLLAAKLKLSTDEYDAKYYTPAFDLLDKSDSCGTYGPDVQPMIDRLIGLGGSDQPLDDQSGKVQVFGTAPGNSDAGDNGDSDKASDKT